MKTLGTYSMLPLIQRTMMIDAYYTVSIFLAQCWITSATHLTQGHVHVSNVSVKQLRISSSSGDSSSSSSSGGSNMFN
jgi:hypothetical protein